MRLKLLAAAAMLVGLSVGSAMAATLPPERTACATGGITLASGSYAGCEGAFNANNSWINNSANLDLLMAQFGITSYTFAGKAEESNGWSGGAVSVTSGQGATSGAFSLTGLAGNLVLIAKSANCFSAYSFTGVSNPTSGGFNTGLAGFLGGNTCEGNNPPGISNLSVYSAGGQPEVIPLPAAGWLLLAGVGGLAAIRRRRKVA